MGGVADTVVGYIVGEDGRGEYIYACVEHTVEHLREPHREVTAVEADEVEACCNECARWLYDSRFEGGEGR